MKQNMHSPLREELARARQVGPHPDLDVLAALGEGRLLEPERRELFAHLAACADCRELLSVASTAAEHLAAHPGLHLVQRPARPPLKEWLPWVSVAAGLLIVCSTVLLYRQKTEQKERAAITAPVQQRLPQESSGSNPEPAEGAKQKRPEAARGASGLLTAPAQSGSAFSGAGRGDSQDSATSAVRAHWRINSAGQVERSFAGGAWEAVLPNEQSKMTVVSVFDENVWVGGENTRVYHSADGGSTWKRIFLPEKNSADHTIAHIRFSTSRAGTVEAADGSSWTTANGGATWN